MFNPQVVARRIASRINWLRKIFGKGEGVFFQYEFTSRDFENRLRGCQFEIVYSTPFDVDFGLRDDFRGLYPIVRPFIQCLEKIKALDKAVRRTFAPFILFVCRKSVA